MTNIARDRIYPEFRESDFRDLIHAIAELRPVRDSMSVNTGELLLRFDIDYSLFSIPPILKVLSEFEGLSASFYILVDSGQYNVFNRRSRAIIDDIIDHGYEVGLHFNPPPAQLIKHSMQFEFNLQKEILTRAIDRKIYSYSTHFPSVFGFFQSDGGERNLYSEPYFGLGRYISDSSHADPRRILEAMVGNGGSVFQLLLHPENYFGSKLTYASNLYEHFGMLYNQLLLDFGVNAVMQKELGETSSLRDLLNVINK